MKIDMTTISEASDSIRSLLVANMDKIDTAFLREDPLTVNLSVKFKAKDGGIDIDSNISFVLDRVKDSTQRRVVEKTPIEELLEGK